MTLFLISETPKPILAFGGITEAEEFVNRPENKDKHFYLSEIEIKPEK